MRVYNAGIDALMKGTREDAKRAYFNFNDAQAFVPGYKDVVEYLDKSKFEGHPQGGGGTGWRFRPGIA
jgi:hypothetical protein